MKRTIIASIFSAVAILGSASLSWGIVVDLDLKAFNFVVTTGSPLHHIDYTETTSIVQAQVTPNGVLVYTDGFGSFNSGISASVTATTGNSAPRWATDATAIGNLTPAAVNPSPNATPLFSGYNIYNSNGITNHGAGITLSTYSQTDMGQNFNLLRANGTSPTNVMLDFDWLYNLTVTPDVTDPPDIAYTYEIFFDALLSSDGRPSATYNALIDSGLIADGADHLTHVTMTVPNSPINTSGQFYLTMGSELDSTGSVPEPSTFLLLGAGLGGLALLRRKARK
jgi:hypothetical protein